MGKPSFSRADRLANAVQKELGTLINTRKLKEFKNPAFQGLISVTEVRVTNGNQHIEVLVSVLEEEYQDSVLQILKESIPSLRGELCRCFKLRLAPSLNIQLDDSIQRGTKMLSLLDSLVSNE